MTAQTERSPRAPLTAAEISALEAHRLDKDLTYRELARRIGVALSKVHQLLNSSTITANDRTAFKVREYLKSIAAQGSSEASA